jgi:hypothetical protein
MVWQIVAVAVVVSLAYFGYVRFFGGSGVHLPDSVAGMDRIDSPDVDRVLEQTRKQVSGLDATIDGAVYGQDGKPSAVIMIISGGAVEAQNGTDFFQQFSTGFTSTAGNVRIDVSPLMRSDTDGTRYTCARLRGSLSGGLCMWQDEAAIGFVLTYGQGVTATATLTSTVRQEVES